MQEMSNKLTLSSCLIAIQKKTAEPVAIDNTIKQTKFSQLASTKLAYQALLQSK